MLIIAIPQVNVTKFNFAVARSGIRIERFWVYPKISTVEIQNDQKFRQYKVPNLLGFKYTTNINIIFGPFISDCRDFRVSGILWVLGFCPAPDFIILSLFH